MTKNNRDNERVRCCQLKERINIKVLAMTFLLFTFFYELPAKAAPEKKPKPPYVSARCAVAIDAKTKRTLYEKDAHLITPMASTTKIITALVALKYGDLDKKVVISAKASGIRGSVVGYRKGEEITIRELIYGLMLRSGNDASIAIAEGISGSVEGFSKLMNEFAGEIGLVDSHFESPHGLDSSMHYTTAYDLAVATARAKEIKEFNDIVSSKDISRGQYGFSRDFHNINKILWLLPQANGVKTGYTGKAGKCLVSSVCKEGNDIVIVLINCPQRWKETKAIYDYINQQYEYKRVMSKDERIDSINSSNNSEKSSLICKQDIWVPVKVGAKVEAKVALPRDIIPPVSKDEKLGTLNIFEDDNLIYKTPLFNNSTFEKKKGLRKWLKIFD